METPEEPQKPLIDQLKDYAELRIKLAKYKAIDGGSSIIASIIADLVVIISMLLAFVFASFTLAFFLASVFNSFWAGFGCVSLLYLFIAIICKLNKGAFERPIANAFVQKFFKN
ncbi:MAG: phage holin family protein [Mucilaginibacter sp.]